MISVVVGVCLSGEMIWSVCCNLHHRFLLQTLLLPLRLTHSPQAEQWHCVWNKLWKFICTNRLNLGLDQTESCYSTVNQLKLTCSVMFSMSSLKINFQDSTPANALANFLLWVCPIKCMKLFFFERFHTDIPNWTRSISLTHMKIPFQCAVLIVWTIREIMIHAVLTYSIWNIFDMNTRDKVWF